LKLKRRAKIETFTISDKTVLFQILSHTPPAITNNPPVLFEKAVISLLEKIETNSQKKTI
jgi:hypothetical protein